MQQLPDFGALKLSLASPEEIKSWSYGEVTEAETINYRTLKPEKDGLFDERIFGPTKDFECYCGKYKRARYKGVVCDKCGVEVTYSRVRRERMGHIELAAPVIHVWYLKRYPSKITALLNVGQKDLESVIYFAQFMVIEVDEERKAEYMDKMEKDLEEKKCELEDEDNNKIKALNHKLEVEIKEISEAKDSLTEADELRIEGLKNENRRAILRQREELAEGIGQLETSYNEVRKLVEQIEKRSILSESEMAELAFWGVNDFFVAEMGADAVLKVLAEVNLDEEIEALYRDIHGKSKARRKKAIKRLRVVQGMKDARIDPTWMVLKILPVIPPELRPMVQLPGGRFATSDLNDLYRRVINRNNRLRDLQELGAPDIILQNEKRMLQEAVDALIEGERRPRRGRKQLQSLSEMLKGKQGRFRRNLLGKRVDYSGRSVIVSGPELHIDQVGLPKEMALELFKPFVLRDLIREGLAPNLKSAKNVLEQRGDEVWDILEHVTKEHPVLINRPPTLHRQNIQAFYPILIEGKAIAVHPAVVGGFAGDFDGDAMSVHVPLSEPAIEEARERLLSPHNLLKLSDGKPIVDLNHEIAFGLYYLTVLNGEEDEKQMSVFYSLEQAVSAYQNNCLALHAPIKIRLDGEEIVTSAGRIIFNWILPEKLRFVNQPVERGLMRKLIADCFDVYGKFETAKLVDQFKTYGARYATISGLSWSKADFAIPSVREQLVAEALKKIDQIEDNFAHGLMTERERHNQIVSVWDAVVQEMTEATMHSVEPSEPIQLFMGSNSFSVSPQIIRNVTGMRGLMVDSQGEVQETPVRSSMVEGFSSYEGLLNMVGGRKAMIDVALMTARAGYLTRRLVDAVHDVLVCEEDCGAGHGVVIRKRGDVEDWSLRERITGRVAGRDVKSKAGKVLVRKNGLILQAKAEEIEAAGVEEVEVRSPLTCESNIGICQLCYGMDMATRKLVNLGEAVGVVAAESIGEPGTQLTLHSKRRAGAAGKEITQGLPRVEELFEARTPKHEAVVAELSGTITSIEEKGDMILIAVEAEEVIDGERIKEDRIYEVPNSSNVVVQVGEIVTAGDGLTEGHLDIDRILDLKGILPAQMYLLSEIQSVYRGQGVAVHDKHIEIVIRKMSKNIKVLDPGDSTFLPGEHVSWLRFYEVNQDLERAGKQPARGQRTIVGISKAALLTESWLSAASFEETPNVLTAASVNERPQVDHLRGLKENVIIGRLIPTGERVGHSGK